jgi:histidinol-phosphate aminotransferase
MDVERLMNTGLRSISPYVGGKPADEVSREYGVSDPVKMNSNENPIGVSPKALQDAARILPKAHIYPEGSNRILREAIGQRLGVDSECVIVGNGADEIIYYIAMAFTNDGDEVVIPSLTFPIYEIAFKMMRARIVTSEMDGFRIDLNAILARVTGRTKMIVLCNPNNPTGDALGKDAVSAFVREVPESVVVLMDEAYMEFADQEDFPDSIKMWKQGRENLVVVRTLSKAFGLAGFRVGFGIGKKEMVSLMNRIKLPFNISIVSQYAAAGALKDKQFLEETLENTRRGREMIYSALDTLGISYVRSSTNFILIDTEIDGDLMAEQLMKRGVIVRSAKNYGTPTCIRVTVGTEKQNTRFITELTHVLEKGDGGNG